MKNIVTIGGGTGSFTILSGLKKIPDVTITAIVSMADDGGSTGVLRDELGVLPPGDVRQCLIALSEHSDTVRKLMGYRFEEGRLSGYSFGNIFLAALEKVTGNFAKGVEVASDILKVRGTVVPVTDDKARLCITLEDGTVLKGEDVINHTDMQALGVAKIHYDKSVGLNTVAQKAIENADVVILGPGNYYCSVLPNIAVSGMLEALKNTKAKIVFPVNLTNKKGHTLYWTAQGYVEDIEKYLGRSLDIVLVNTLPPSQNQIETYELQEGDGVLVVDDLPTNKKIFRLPLLSQGLISFQKTDALALSRSFIRHDSVLFAKVIEDLLR
ncbi:MAG: gluconeogenesis factor YvcK family protein [Minisyncoccia bacterium]